MKHNNYSKIGENLYTAELRNGLRINVVTKPGFRLSYAVFATNYGGAHRRFFLNGRWHDTPAGVAHFLEHKMFDMPDGDNALSVLSANGAQPNAFTSSGMTAYYFDCTSGFEENLRMLLKFVSTPYFTDETVQKEQGIIGQEIGMIEDNPEWQCYKQLMQGLYHHSPARTPIAGSVESIREITAQTLYDCHKAFYTPANMCLVVVGDVDGDEVLRLAEEILPKTSGPLIPRDYGAEEPLTPCQKETRSRMEVSMPTFSVGFKCPPPEKGLETMRREIIGDLVAEILIGESSPLYQRLYEEGLIDAEFSAGYESVKDACLFSAGGDSKDPEAVLAALLNEAERIEREGFDPALFERLKKSALGRRTRDLDSFESICYRICAYHFDGADYFRFPEAYASVTPEDVKTFLRETVRPERAAMSVVRPKE